MKFYAILFLLSLSACSEGSETNDPSSETVHANTEKAAFSSIGFVEGCYLMVSHGDSIILDLKLADSLVTGRFIHNEFEAGTTYEEKVSGKLQDSLLYVNSTIELPGAEKHTSEFIFLIRKDSLIVGDGETINTDEKLRFKDPTKVTFTRNAAYVRVECKL